MWQCQPTSFHAPTVLLQLRYSTWALRYSTPGYVSACLRLSSTPSAQPTFFYVMWQRLPSSSPLQPHPLHSLSMPTLICGRIIYVYSFPTQALMAEMCAWQPFTHQTGTTIRLHLHFSWTFLQLLQQNCQSSETRFQDRTLSTTYVSQGNMWMQICLSFCNEFVWICTLHKQFREHSYDPFICLVNSIREHFVKLCNKFVRLCTLHEHFCEHSFNSLLNFCTVPAPHDPCIWLVMYISWTFRKNYATNWFGFVHEHFCEHSVNSFA